MKAEGKHQAEMKVHSTTTTGATSEGVDCAVKVPAVCEASCASTDCYIIAAFEFNLIKRTSLLCFCFV